MVINPSCSAQCVQNPNEIKMLKWRSTMTQRRKTGRGLEEWRIGHGGLHQLLEKNAQEVTFLAPLLWLDLCSTLKKIQYYSTHLWCKRSGTNTRFRKQSGWSPEAVRSTAAQIGGVSNPGGMNSEEACTIWLHQGRFHGRAEPVTDPILSRSEPKRCFTQQ